MELLVVMGIVGVISAIAVPSLGDFGDQAKVTATAQDLRTFAQAFRAYYMLEGEFPPDTHEEVPDGMEEYLADVAFEREAAISGRYNWEGPDVYSYSGVSLTTTEATTEQLQQLDDILDDGNLSIGFFRQAPNGRYTYIIQEN